MRRLGTIQNTDTLEIPSSDDQSYVEDLGLIVSRPQLRIANRIYREIIPRELTVVTQSRIVQESSWYLTPDNHLDMNKLAPRCFKWVKVVWGSVFLVCFRTL